MKEAVHQRGGAGLHGHIGLNLILQNHIAVAVLHTGEGTGTGIDALVDEGAVSRRHFLGGDAVGIAAQRHSTHLLTVGLGQGGEAQTVRHEIIGIAGAQHHIGTHGAGIQRLHQCAAHRDKTLEAAVVVLGIGAVVQLQHRVVIQRGRAGDNALIQGRSIGADGLGGRPAGPHGGSPVPAAIRRLGAGAAHHGHHIAGIGINDGNGALQLLRLAGALGTGIGGIAEILEHALGDFLILVILRGVDLIALAEQGVFRSTVVIAELIHQRLDHIVDQRVGEIGIAGLVLGHCLRGLFLRFFGGIHHGLAVVVAGIAVTVGKDDLLRLGGVILLLRDLSLIQQGVKDQHLTLAVLLPAPLAFKGAVLAGVVGDADQTGALGQRQLADALAEIGAGRSLHAVAGLAQTDAVQVRLQDLILVIALFQLQCAVYLHHLTLDGALVVAGHVLDELLGDGGTALHAPARQSAEDGAHRAPEVHAVMAFKALVLNGDGGILHVLGDVVKVDPDTVLAVAVQGLIHDPLVGLGVQIVQLRGNLGLQLVHIDLYLSLQGCVDPCHENAGEDGEGQHHHQQDRADDKPCLSLLFRTRRTLRLLIRFFLSVTGALLWAAEQAAALLLVVTHNRAPPFLCCISDVWPARRFRSSAGYTYLPSFMLF